MKLKIDELPIFSQTSKWGAPEYEALPSGKESTGVNNGVKRV